MTYKEELTKTFLNKNIKLTTNYPNNKQHSGEVVEGEVIKIYFYEDEWEGDTVSLVILKEDKTLKDVDLTLSTEYEILI